MLRRLRDHPADVVETLAPGASADLMEIACGENAGLLPVELAQPGKEHGADGHVDADAQRVRATDDFQQSLLRELLDEDAILRQQPRVMQADAMPQPFLDLSAVWAGEFEAFDRAGDGGLFLARADVDAREILRALRRFKLSEMDDVHRRLAFCGQAFERLGQRQFRVGMLQRDRPVRGGHGGGRALVQLRQFFLEERRLAQRGGHEQETRLRHREQRNLPRAAALPVRVIVELVHHDILHVRLRAFAERDVREDLRRATEDGRVAIHRGVAGAEADVVRTEFAAEREPLLVHERLDRAGVNRAFALRDGFEMQRGGDERFAGAGGRVEDDVLVLEELEHRRLLRGIELELAALDVFEEAPEEGVVARAVVARNEFVKRGRHGLKSVARPNGIEKNGLVSPPERGCRRSP